MTATVRFAEQAAAPLIRLPLSSLLRQGEQTVVWVYDPKSSTVNTTPVSVAGPNGNDLMVSNGLAPGQVVVTAGAHLLQPGQRVKLLPGDTRPAVAAPEVGGRNGS